jgi:NDP-sugar pyrophosphorylase family protein
MRVIDNRKNVYGFKLKNYFYSVDVIKELSMANKDIENNLLFNQYKHSI